VERDGLATVARADVLTRVSFDVHLVTGEARLKAKGATCPPLTSEAVTHRDAYGISRSLHCIIKTRHQPTPSP
jgi:hypothetical protein